MKSHRPNRGFQHRDRRPKSLFRGPLVAKLPTPTPKQEPVLPTAPDLKSIITSAELEALYEEVREMGRKILTFGIREGFRRALASAKDSSKG